MVGGSGVSVNRLHLGRIVIICLIALPWLNPFAPGPSPSVVPLLFSWAAGVALCITYRASATQPANDEFSISFANGWILAGVVSSAIGLLQYFGASGSLSTWINQAALGEAYANLRQRNQFATLTNISIASLVFFAVSGLSGKKLHWLLFAAVALLAAGNAASASRTGFVQLLLLSVLCGVWGLWRYSAVKQILITALLIYSLATLALPRLAGLDPDIYGLLARLSAGDEACSSRITLWANVIHLISLRPWLGWGWGELGYAHYITLYDGTRFCAIVDNAHNLPLHLAVELGLPFALAASGGFIWWVLRRRPWLETDPVRQLAWAVLVLVLLHSMLEYPLWYGPFQTAALLCLFMLWPPSKQSGMTVQKTKERPVVVVLYVVAAMIFIAIGVFAAWDYHRVSQIYLPSSARDVDYRENTLEKIRSSRLFASQVQFAELSITPLTRANAQWMYDTSLSLLHYSPEPQVIQKLIESAVMLGKDDVAMAHLARYRAAFPQEYARWAAARPTAALTLPR